MSRTRTQGAHRKCGLGAKCSVCKPHKAKGAKDRDPVPVRRATQEIPPADEPTRWDYKTAP